MKLIDQIELALEAADELADAARDLNDGPNSKVVDALIKRYRTAVRGLDLSPFREKGDMP